jgi:copper chaperone CopZ
MKKITQFLILCTLCIVACSAPNATQMTVTTGDKTETFKVSGACNMCKKRIEMAVFAVSGIKKASWNLKEQTLTVSYDAQKTSNEVIQKRIVGIGHDTEKFKASDKSYKNLPDCCRYREIAVHDID